MRPSLLRQTILSRIDLEIRQGRKVRPSYLTGPLGVGKTQLLQQIAQDLGIYGHVIHAPLMLNEDFGMPFPRDGSVEFLTPEHKFPFADSDVFPDHGLLIVDEASQLTPDQQKIWANVFQERELHGRKLKPGWAIAATGNRMQDRAGAGRLLSHFNDRFTTFPFDASLDDWADWAQRTGKVKPVIVGFLRFRPDLFSAHDPDKEKSPTPRAWTEGVNVSLDCTPDPALFDAICGDVGEGAAAEFTAFLRTYRDLPDPELVIARPDDHAVPVEMSVRYALASALAHHANETNFGNVLRFAQRMDPEFTVLIVRDALRLRPEIEETRAYVDWAIGPGHKLLFDRS